MHLCTSHADSNAQYTTKMASKSGWVTVNNKQKEKEKKKIKAQKLEQQKSEFLSEKSKEKERFLVQQTTLSERAKMIEVITHTVLTFVYKIYFRSGLTVHAGSVIDINTSRPTIQRSRSRRDLNPLTSPRPAYSPLWKR